MTVFTNAKQQQVQSLHTHAHTRTRASQGLPCQRSGQVGRHREVECDPIEFCDNHDSRSADDWSTSGSACSEKSNQTPRQVVNIPRPALLTSRCCSETFIKHTIINE